MNLETVNKQKIKSLLDISSQPPHDNFSSLLRTMSEEQQEELNIVQMAIKLVTKLKQEFCKHPKKDHDTCDGEKYCMNCNKTLYK